MFLQFLQLRVDPENLETLREFYNRMVIPKLQTVPGCCFASLIQNQHHPDEFISLTLWDSQEAAEAYDQSETYRKLHQLTEPLLAESTHWKINLSESLELEYGPSREEPILKEFTISESSTPDDGIPQENPRMYVRMYTAKIQESQREECRRIYREEIVPALLKTEGCQYAYLIESLHEKDQAISLTIWDSKEHADNYEKSGLFQELVGKVKHTFSPLYQWKMALEKDFSARVKTTEDAQLQKYHLVTGKRLH